MGNCLTQEEHIHSSSLNFKLHSCFIKWHIECKNMKIKSLQNNLILNSTRSAELHQQLANTENIISEMERKVNDFNKNDKLVKIRPKLCCICFNEIQKFIVCDNGHVHCDNCVNMHCRNLYDSFVKVNEVKCLSTEECECKFDLNHLIQFEFGEKLFKEFIHDKSLKMISDIFETPFSDIKLRYIRHDGSYKVYACPSCGYGPLEHYNCNDLSEFNKLNDSNTCPNCNFFAENISSYNKWDGCFLECA